jgi:hypothetical protein
MLKKNLAPVVLAVALTIACSAVSSHPPLPAPPPAPTSSASAPGSPQTNWSDSIQAVEVVAIRAANGRVSRVGSELRIQLLDGRTAILKDDTTPGLEFALPRYASYLKAIHSHVVHRLPYEGSGAYLVIDDSTADSTIVFGMPVVSLDGTRFALTSMSGEADYDPSLLEVWRMVAKRPEKEFSYDSGEDSWDPSDAVWRDSATIDFIKNSRSAPYPTTPGRLTRTGTTWALSESPH